MPIVKKRIKALVTQPQEVKIKQGENAKKDASNKSQTTEKQPVKAKKPVKTIPVKVSKEEVQEKVLNAAPFEGKKRANQKTTTTDKKSGKEEKSEKGTPVKDEGCDAQSSHGPQVYRSPNELKELQVMIKDCPCETAEKDVRQLFPNAEEMHMVYDYGDSGTCFVRFKTREEAYFASSMTDVTIQGKPVHVSFLGNKKAMVEEERPRQIVIQDCPWKLTEEDVKKVFPAAKWVRLMKKDRQFTGTCFVTFPTIEEANAACQRTEVTIRGRAVKVSKTGHTLEGQSFKELNDLEVVIKNCPWKTTEKDVKKIFPRAERVHMATKDGWFTGTCFVRFNTYKEAVAASKKKSVILKGRPVYFSLANQNPKPAKRPKLSDWQ